MGYLGVKTMVAHLRKEPTEAKIDTGAVLVTPANRGTEEVRELLSPPSE
jgi:ribose transport system substrate-binding protein